MKIDLATSSEVIKPIGTDSQPMTSESVEESTAGFFNHLSSLMSSDETETEVDIANQPVAEKSINGQNSLATQSEELSPADDKDASNQIDEISDADKQPEVGKASPHPLNSPSLMSSDDQAQEVKAAVTESGELLERLNESSRALQSGSEPLASQQELTQDATRVAEQGGKVLPLSDPDAMASESEASQPVNSGIEHTRKESTGLNSRDGMHANGAQPIRVDSNIVASDDSYSEYAPSSQPAASLSQSASTESSEETLSQSEQDLVSAKRAIEQELEQDFVARELEHLDKPMATITADESAQIKSSSGVSHPSPEHRAIEWSGAPGQPPSLETSEQPISDIKGNDEQRGFDLMSGEIESRATQSEAQHIIGQAPNEREDTDDNLSEIPPALEQYSAASMIPWNRSVHVEGVAPPVHGAVDQVSSTPASVAATKVADTTTLLNTQMAQAQVAPGVVVPSVAALSGSEPSVSELSVSEQGSALSSGNPPNGAVSSAVHHVDIKAAQNSDLLASLGTMNGPVMTDSASASTTATSQGAESAVAAAMATSGVLGTARAEVNTMQGNVVISQAMTSQEMADKVNDQVQLMLSKNLKNIDIRLDPPELGRMQIRMNMNGDSTSVHFTVANAQAREVLDQSMPRLREMFAQQGIQLADTSVSQQSSQQQGRSAGQGEAGGTQQSSPNGLADEDNDASQSIDLNVTTQQDGISYYA
ncbi:flagellar hook-length control protein FliK [Vibrio sp. WXL210]|uniref:flagellar hook-length control protein FliK n=1 Tax=Vibrio sp. WXL210 TaxID=3450709 RepID=UPI003EC8782E